jgi:lipid II:glycine glycyltransferase (peptidoglycan interpeptide bridge formation enzyme)
MDTVWTASLTPRDAADYDAFVASAGGGHFSQTRAWAAVAVAGRRRGSAFFLARRAGIVIGAALVQRPRIVGQLLAPLATIERGPVTRDPADLAAVLEGLVRLARRRGVLRLRVMPYWDDDAAAGAEEALAAAGFHSVQRHDGAHASSVRIALAEDDDHMLAGSDRKKLRYELRHAEKEGVVVRLGEPLDFTDFEKLDRDLARAQGKRPRPRAWFDAVAGYLADPERGALFVAEHRDRPLAAVLMCRHAELSVFVAGASIPEATPFSKMAVPLLAAMRWARGVGCTVCDLGGIPLDGDRNDKRLAIAQFKLDFSKRRVRLVREHARWV